MAAPNTKINYPRILFKLPPYPRWCYPPVALGGCGQHVFFLESEEKKKGERERGLGKGKKNTHRAVINSKGRVAEAM